MNNWPKRKKQNIILLVIILLFLFCVEYPGYSQRGTDRGGLYYRALNDTVKTSRSGIILKVNPFQVLFNEIPVSVEVLFSKKASLQFQAGYIFPSAKGSFLRKLFEEIGTGGTTTGMHVLNYRRSPYNNHGLSFKLEFRSAGKKLYYAPQLMYKHCYYNDETFMIFSGQVTMKQTESKSADILGVGLMIGRQSYEGILVVDWYGGLGLRFNSTNAYGIKVTSYYYPLPSYNHPDEYKMLFYPYINFGMRIGIKLERN